MDEDSQKLGMVCPLKQDIFLNSHFFQWFDWRFGCDRWQDSIFLEENKLENQKTYRALDLGFGYTKFTRGHCDTNNKLDVSSFPSYAAPVIGDGILDTGVLNNLSLVKVSAEGQDFFIGEDVRRAADGVARQLLEASFFKSPQYLALARGAFSFMKIPAHGNIDVLTLGLPLNIYRDKGVIEHITKALSGTHNIPDIINGKDQTKTIVIKDLHIIPQVVGSLIFMSHESGLNEIISDQQNLTIDVGYGTLLWLVTDGFSPLPARSNGNMGGVSSILQKVVRAMDSQATTNITILDRLDKALLSKKPSIKLNGSDVEIEKYHGVLQSAVNENLTELIRGIGNTQDIDNIFLTGGGAHLYLNAIKMAFPGRKINTSEKLSRFTNVYGFQLLAQSEE